VGTGCTVVAGVQRGGACGSGPKDWRSGARFGWGCGVGTEARCSVGRNIGIGALRVGTGCTVVAGVQRGGACGSGPKDWRSGARFGWGCAVGTLPLRTARFVLGRFENKNETESGQAMEVMARTRSGKQQHRARSSRRNTHQGQPLTPLAPESVVVVVANGVVYTTGDNVVVAT